MHFEWILSRAKTHWELQVVLELEIKITNLYSVHLICLVASAGCSKKLILRFETQRCPETLGLPSVHLAISMDLRALYD